MGGSSSSISKGRKYFLRKARPYILLGGALLTIWWAFSIPSQLFRTSYSTVTEDVNGELLGARIAKDGQWRFPILDSVPFRFEKCIIAFEDERFYYHPGVDPVAIVRAIGQNWKADEVISGASTLTMQVVRLSRGNPNRSYFEKIAEMLRATRVEASYSKREILILYASHAPFGGNVVGLEAASWRYYHRPPHMLSWGESASLAVLPNAPSQVRPDKNRSAYLAKRNRLLAHLLERGDIDSVTYKLALLEPLPAEPKALPNLAHHLSDRQNRERQGQRIRTSIRANWQTQIQSRVDLHSRRWIRNEVHNAAALAMDIETGEVVAYVGNTNNRLSDGHGIDMLNHPRSTGSILKPFLYQLAFEMGLLSRHSLIADIPTRFGDFTPTNFDNEYRGAIPVQNALQLSLNVPAARVLRDIGVPIFERRLIELGMKDLSINRNRYGLSLILGGAEVRPIQVAHAYRQLILAAQLKGEYSSVNVWNGGEALSEPPSMDPVAAYTTLSIMEGLERPTSWKRWGKSEGRRMAWKTGTSYGFRDAWAVGTDGKWLVVVWTGNATNEGRPGVIGVETSAPLLFEVMSILPKGDFMDEPIDEEREVQMCLQTGFAAQSNCVLRKKVYVGHRGLAPCGYCKTIQLNEEGLRIDHSCSTHSTTDTSWMILPAGMAWFAMQSGRPYQPPPPWDTDCSGSSEDALQWIYPESTGEVVKRTRDLDGKLGSVVLEASHISGASSIFWFIDEEYHGNTTHEHRMEVTLPPGVHTLTIADERGNQKTIQITVIE